METKQTVKCLINNGHIGYSEGLSYILKEEIEINPTVKGFIIINDFGEEQLVPKEWFKIN